MKKIILFATMILTGLMIISCGESDNKSPVKNHPDTHESLIVEMMKVSKKVLRIMESIHDESSADAAIVKMEKLNITLKDLTKRMDKLGEIDPELDQKLQDKYKDEMENIGEVMYEIISEIMMEPYGGKVMDALDF